MTDQTPPSPTDAAPRTSDDPSEEAPGPVDNLLALKLLVVFLGVLFVVVALTFVMLLILKKPDEETAPGDTAMLEENAAAREGLSEMRLDLAPGEEIIDMSMGGRDLALHLRAGEEERLVIIDPYTGQYRAIVTVGEAESDDTARQ